MPRLTLNTPLNISGALVGLGVMAYHGTGKASKTALIPSMVGGAMVLPATLSQIERLRTPALKVTLGLGLIGMAGAARGLPKLLTLLRGQAVDKPAAALTQGAMVGLCAAAVAHCVTTLRREPDA